MSQNAYTYTENNPINYSDPSGHSILSALKSAGTAIANTAKKVATAVVNTAKKVATAVVNTAKKVATAVVSTAKKVATAVTNTVKKVATTVSTAVKSVVSPTTSVSQRSTSQNSALSSASSTIKNTTVKAKSTPANNVPQVTQLVNGKPTLVNAPTLKAGTKAAQEFVAARGCESTQRAEKQNTNVALDALKLTAEILFRSTGLDQVLAFGQGLATALTEDVLAPYQQLANAIIKIFGGSGVNPNIGVGQNDAVAGAVTYEPWFGNQNAFSAGRIVGHIGTVAIGIIEAAEGITVIVGGIATGAGGAPVSGGTSLLIAVPVVAEGAAVAVDGAGKIASGVTGLFDDPNIQFSVGDGAGQSGKVTSPNQMQTQVERGQAPKDVKRVDSADPNLPGSQPHIHFGDDKAALNMDGTWHDSGKQIPEITKKTAKWIVENGWTLPTD